MTDYWKAIPIVVCPDDVKPHVERVIGLHISNGQIVACNGMMMVATDTGYCLTSLSPEQLADIEAHSRAACEEMGITYRPLRAAVPRREPVPLPQIEFKVPA